jgi:hypothetical protein
MVRLATFNGAFLNVLESGSVEVVNGTCDVDVDVDVELFPF